MFAADDAFNGAESPATLNDVKIFAAVITFSAAEVSGSPFALTVALSEACRSPIIQTVALSAAVPDKS